MTVTRISALALLGSAMFQTLAFGADPDPIYADAPEIASIEDASGFYVRGDLAYLFRSDLDGSLRLGEASGAAPGFFDADGRIGDGVAVSGGAGYQFTDTLRGDVTLGYWQHGTRIGGGASSGCGDEFDCRWNGSSDLEAFELMANGYVDLGTVMGFTPYVGGGLGAAHLAYDDVAVTSRCGCLAGPDGDAELEGANSWRFAFAVDAGVAYGLTEALSLDVGYRYLNVDDGDAFDANNGAAGEADASVRDDGFDRHAVRVGLRYSFR